MASRSSFLQRLSPSRDSQRSHRPLRSKNSEYDLSDLSPRAQEISPPSRHDTDYMSSSPEYARPSLGPIRLSDEGVAVPGYNKRKPKVLFAGPPPPIAQSAYMYKDFDDQGRSTYHNKEPPSFSTTITSVFFDRPQRAPASRPPAYEPDSVWRSIQRREMALQQDLQRFLDAQAAGLAAGLGRPLDSPLLDTPSDTDSSVRGGTSRSGRSARLPMDRSTITGEVIPIRQPRPRKLGLRAARTALAKNMTLLADLKAEEDASLDSALGARKAALAQLKKMSTRRAGIADELRSLENDDEEPLAQELKELRGEHDGVSEQISELEGELVRMKNRRRLLEKRMDDVSSRREAGLSGYRGALREVDGRITAILGRPPVKPLDIEAMSGAAAGTDRNLEDDGSPPSTGGLEFLKLRPERRTADMASDWWSAETKLLEDRKAEVAKVRAALEEGLGVWKDAIQLVSGFEAYMRQQVIGDDDTDGSENGKAKSKGKDLMPTPEMNMKSSLTKIRPAISALEGLMTIVQDKGWNLLVCAIGAELGAFQEAEQMMQGALEAAGFEDDEQKMDEGSDPPTAIQSRISLNGPGGALVDTDDDERDAESGNEVPPDLFSREDSQDTEHSQESLRRKDRGDSAGGESGAEGSEQDNNAPPPEFLAEH